MPATSSYLNRPLRSLSEVHADQRDRDRSVTRAYLTALDAGNDATRRHLSDESDRIEERIETADAELRRRFGDKVTDELNWLAARLSPPEEMDRAMRAAGLVLLFDESEPPRRDSETFRSGGAS